MGMDWKTLASCSAGAMRAGQTLSDGYACDSSKIVSWRWKMVVNVNANPDDANDCMGLCDAR